MGEMYKNCQKDQSITEDVRISGLRLGLVTICIFLITACFHFYGLDQWPWDHDEVPCLIELGYSKIQLSGAIGEQAVKSPRIMPVWYELQGLALRVLPANEWGTRVLPAFCGVLAVVAAFWAVARYWSLLQACALVILLNGSQCYIWQSQQNRFYSMAILFQILTWIAVMIPKVSLLSILLCILFSILGVLCHSLLVVVFVLGFASACAAFLCGLTRRSVVYHCGATAAASGLLYFLYLRPFLKGWVSGGTYGTNEVVSFLAQIGLPTIALAILGSGAILFSSKTNKTMAWWAILAAAGLSFIAGSRFAMGAWNPRYCLLFMPAVFVVASYGVEQVARLLTPMPFRIAWLGCITVLLLPKLASHYQDGSRHDFRSAASVVVNSTKEGQNVVSNWPETLQYYLPEDSGIKVEWLQSVLPQTDFIAVISSNAWQPVFQSADRKVKVLAEIRKRRFDEQSHIVRVYQVSAANE
ncbi:MAG: hypothetical protein ACJ8FY_19905 [Gemmataceae bacterium]